MSRRRRQRVRHHAFIGLGVVAATALGLLVLPGEPLWRASAATAWLAGGLLLLTLVLGPITVLRRRPNPVSNDLRRDAGIWTGVAAAVHTGLGLFVHFRGRPWTYFVWGDGEGRSIPLRYDPFGVASWTGLAAMVLLVLLAAISSDLALRRLGAGRWKALQRLNYLILGFVALHGVVFQQLERRGPPFVLLLIGLLAGTIAIQLAGCRAVRAARESARVGRAGAADPT